MSRPNNNNSARPIQSHQNDTPGQLNDVNLARVPEAGNSPGFERFRGCHAADESYFADARIQDRPAHESRLREQIRRVDELMR
ncbi:hypothetical protein VTN77DRAFT_1615 [Rasamsonia byssochlamydoides]|uniref:uncharacterized protein n=1 Tax=Rasamsonia byssochlamydoides TaxID=89139 RepID=UPI003743AF8D